MLLPLDLFLAVIPLETILNYEVELCVPPSASWMGSRSAWCVSTSNRVSSHPKVSKLLTAGKYSTRYSSSMSHVRWMLTGTSIRMAVPAIGQAEGCTSYYPQIRYHPCTTGTRLCQYWSQGAIKAANSDQALALYHSWFERSLLGPP